MFRQESEAQLSGDEAGSNRKPLETGGFDMLQIAIYGGWDPVKFAEVTKRWDLHREQAEGGSEAGAVYQTASGSLLRIGPSGAKYGCYCRWVAEWNGCRLAFVNRQAASDKMHGVFVQLGSLSLMTVGLDTLWAELLELLAELGFKYERHSISRTDIAVDLPGVDVKEFTSLALMGCEITKAREGNLHFGALIEDHETFYRGRGQRVLLRIYNKLLEVESDPAKEAVLIAKRWGGKRPEAATRVEFQVGREVLRDRWGVETIDDLKRALPQIVEWLTSEWYRLTASPVDRENRNHSRATTADAWRAVQRAFADWVCEPPVPWIVPAKVLNTKADHLRKMAIGCLSKFIAIAEPLVSTAGDVRSAVYRLIDEAKEGMIASVEDARLLLSIRYGDGVEWDPSGWAYNGPNAPPIRRVQSA